MAGDTTPKETWTTSSEEEEEEDAEPPPEEDGLITDNAFPGPGAHANGMVLRELPGSDMLPTLFRRRATRPPIVGVSRPPFSSTGGTARSGGGGPALLFI